MTTKKLYKFRTQTVLNETFEVEAESYDQAIDLIKKSILLEGIKLGALLSRVGKLSKTTKAFPSRRPALPILCK